MVAQKYSFVNVCAIFQSAKAINFPIISPKPDFVRNIGAFDIMPRSAITILGATASKVFKVDRKDVTPTMRSRAKAVNFGIIYGMSEYGLAKTLKISAQEARAYINAYFDEYPEVKSYMDKNVQFAKDNGYSKTLLGRKRYINELASSN